MRYIFIILTPAELIFIMIDYFNKKLKMNGAKNFWDKSELGLTFFNEFYVIFNIDS